MSEMEYDLVTIGAGSGGVRASRVAAKVYGAKVAIVELPFGFVSSDSVGGAGGTCVIRGCVPKKLLVYASEFTEAFEDSSGFGWQQPMSRNDVKMLIEKKSKEIERLNGVYVNLLKNSGVEYIEGKGIVLDAHTVEVRGVDGSVMQLRAKNILIATGGHAVKLNIPGVEHSITSDEALVLEEIAQQSIAIIGGGYIAVEFAGIFNGLGAQVHLMYRADFPLRKFDNECRTLVAENLQKRGIQVYSGCNPEMIEPLPNGQYALHYRNLNGERLTIVASKVMFATGRKPSARGIGLEGVGVNMNERSGAIEVDEYSRTNVPSIWAIGDVTDRVNLTPVALMEGKALAATLFGGVSTKPDYQNIPSAVFCQPPLATVGMTEEEAVQKLSGELDIYVSKFRPMKNTLTGRDEKTFMKMIVHVPSDKVVGCHMVGPDGPEIMQGLGVALKCGATKAQFDSTVGIHPSAAEEWVTMSTPARRLHGQGRHVL